LLPLAQALPMSTLMIAMIGPSPRCPLVALIRRSTSPGVALLAARIAAVRMTAIAAPADGEHLTT